MLVVVAAASNPLLLLDRPDPARLPRTIQLLVVAVLPPELLAPTSRPRLVLLLRPRTHQDLPLLLRHQTVEDARR